MNSVADLPSNLVVNAYSGKSIPVASPMAARKRRWILQNSPPEIRPYLAPTSADLTNWLDPRVGWGVVMADAVGHSSDELSRAADAPEPIQRLVRERGGRVYRFVPGANGNRYLRDDKYACDVSTASSPLGTSAGCLPYYLLIVSTPDRVPWSLQYTLNAGRAVGRLSLEGEQLTNYVNRLLRGWESDKQSELNTLIWTTNHGSSDITSLIESLVARPLQEKYAHDSASDIKQARYIGGGDATNYELIKSLKSLQPRMVVTTSHGSTFFDGSRGPMNESLGLPIDQNLQSLVLEDLLASWDPAGTIWYAHACCSAGGDGSTIFKGLVEEGSVIDQILEGVAKCGPLVAPLPTRLLSAKNPAKAFIGHVEPTFDWSVSDPLTNQRFGAPIVTALYDNLFSHVPVGHALRTVFHRLAGIYTTYDNDLRMYNAQGQMLPEMLRDLLVARDVQSMVVIGDPTVAI